jgi:DHA1 family multidrug resistance protein-like MFS transporter
MVPMPILFYRYGKKIRAKSKFAPSPDIEQDKRRDEEARLSGNLNGDVENEYPGMASGSDADKEKDT